MLKIGLIPDENNCYFIVGVWFGLIHPFAHIIKWISICDVIDKDDTDRASIIGTSDGLKSLLPCLHKHRLYGIPNLKFNVFWASLNDFRAELNTDGRVMIELELFLKELQKHAGLSDAWS